MSCLHRGNNPSLDVPFWCETCNKQICYMCFSECPSCHNGYLCSNCHPSGQYDICSSCLKMHKMKDRLSKIKVEKEWIEKELKHKEEEEQKKKKYQRKNETTGTLKRFFLGISDLFSN